MVGGVVGKPIRVPCCLGLGLTVQDEVFGGLGGVY